MASKDIFIAQQKARKHTLEFINTLGVKPPHSVEHEAFSLISRGFYVQLYASLEIFAKKRFEELISTLTHTVVSFESLPEEFQKRAIDNALIALQSRIKVLANDDSVNLRQEIQIESGKISSTGEGNYQISKYSFGYNGSNIPPNEYYDLLNCLKIPNDATYHLKEVVMAIEKNIINIRNDILNIYNRRHTGAHTIDENWGLDDLRRDSDIIYHFGISLDILLTTSIKAQLSLSKRGNPILGNQVKLLKIREQPDGTWKAYHHGQRRRVEMGNTYIDLFQNLKQKAISKDEIFTIIYDKNQNIIDWLEN